MSKWIGRFENNHPEQVACPSFWRLRYMAECPHKCAFCYIPSTYRFGRPKAITEADFPELQRQVEKWLGRPGCGILNAGELSDSFAPAISARASRLLIELFSRQDRHTLLLVTKAMPQELLALAPSPQVIVSFSWGQYFLFGKTGPQITFAFPTREFVVRVARAGWRVRLRVDPLCQPRLLEPFSHLPFERITLGTLRFTDLAHANLSKGDETQRVLANLTTRQANSGTHPWRLPIEQRVLIYRQNFDALPGAVPSIGLCKETPEVYRQLGLDPAENKCNCIL